MRNNHTNLLFVIFVVILFASFCIPVLASESEAVVYGESVSYGAEKNIAIPVYIEGNPGIMGFKISVVFPSTALSLDTVEQGAVTNSGRFSTKADEEGKVVILWNSTSQVTENGSLFILHFIVLDGSKDAIIAFSYYSEDTFNEEYENVPLCFEDIKLISSVDSESVQSFSEANTPANTVVTVNPYLASSSGNSADSGEQISEQDSRIDAAVTEIVKNFSGSEINSIIENTLMDIDSPSIDKIPPDRIDAFAEDIREQLAIDGIEKLDDLSNDELFSALEKVTKGAFNEASGQEASGNNYLFLILSAAAIISIIIITATVVSIRKRNKHDNAHNKEK